MTKYCTVGDLLKFSTYSSPPEKIVLELSDDGKYYKIQMYVKAYIDDDTVDVTLNGKTVFPSDLTLLVDEDEQVFSVCIPDKIDNRDSNNYKNIEIDKHVEVDEINYEGDCN